VTAGPTATKAAARVASELRKAIEQAKLGYEFSPNSFSYSCLSSCLAAEQALAVLSDALSEEERGQEARQSRHHSTMPQ
jgi:hypothetical protein